MRSMHASLNTLLTFFWVVSYNFMCSVHTRIQNQSDFEQTFGLDLRQLIQSERASSSESRHLRSQETPSSVSGSYYSESYLEGSKDDTSSSSNGMQFMLNKGSSINLRFFHSDHALSLISP